MSAYVDRVKCIFLDLMHHCIRSSFPLPCCFDVTSCQSADCGQLLWKSLLCSVGANLPFSALHTGHLVCCKETMRFSSIHYVIGTNTLHFISRLKTFAEVIDTHKLNIKCLQVCVMF